jgi:hypothetical protein
MKFVTTAAFAALMMLGAGAASAQGGQGGPGGNPAMAKVREQCAADMTKFCADETGRERMQCMRENADKLSDGCKSAMAEMRAARQAAGGGAPPSSAPAPQR